MNDAETQPTVERSRPPSDASWLSRLRERGVLRVAGSYAVIAWLLLQIADVTFDPLGVPKWVMTALIIAAVAGFPIAVTLAWFYEIGDSGIVRDTGPTGAERPVVHGRRRYADFVIIGVLLVTVAVLLVRQSDIARPQAPEHPVIAVLPFENIGGDPEQEYFSDGLAQEVLDRLGRVPGLVVTARSSSFSFKGKGLDAKAIAGKLGVTTVLEGTVRRAGSRLKLSAHLVDGATGQLVWSGSFDREMTDVFQVQEELADAIIDAIVPAARGERVAQVVAPTKNLGAYDLYLLGRAATEARVGGRARDAVGFLEQAVALDPDFAKAHAALSRALVLWSIYGHGDAPGDVLGRAKAAAYRALALDPESSEAHAALGTVLRGSDPAAAEAQFVRALEINPSNVVALYDMAVLLGSIPGRDTGDLEDRILRLDPRSAAVWRNRLDRTAHLPDGGVTYRRELERVLELFADDLDSLRLIGFSQLFGEPVEAYRWAVRFAELGDEVNALRGAAIAWVEAGDYERARRAHAELAQRYHVEVEVRTIGIVIAGASGDFDDLNRRLDEALASDPDNPLFATLAAFWWSVQGREQQAAGMLQKAGELHEHSAGPPGTALLDGKQLLPAVLRIYRATGRGAEAEAMAAKYSAQLAKQRNLDVAALAANEGDAKRAVAVLREVVEHEVNLRNLNPAYPWFRSLEVQPGYAEVLAARQRRLDARRAELLKLEAGTTAPVLQLSRSGSSG